MSEEKARISDNHKFTLGLSYYEVMDLPENELDIFLDHSPREEILNWLQWNDPNGVYQDVPSMSEFGNILTREESKQIMMRQILQP